MSTLPTSAETGTDELHLDQFESDDANWYIEQRAVEAGLLPRETLRTVRAGQAARARLQRDEDQRQVAVTNIHSGRIAAVSRGSRPADRFQ